MPSCKICLVCLLPCLCIFLVFLNFLVICNNGVCPLKSTVDAGGMVNTESTAIGELGN